ncbi:mechanosensitive ion channel [Chroococcidiopsis sp. FACHB-1243]|uniref:mechanosensitive ion channel n=1 Tax=Chroococcidiopsis sp. [FACHB-1243] TaxID=2692781 RepID=UPI00177AB4A9|nr:mechanosensitive ion channel [Chroococcidiopsis sp. [FACHB-1243]]MBD2308990.1 mechanosensitive ion channel [Chroococcidiopsis sp. [FACHB-1243]]
MNGTLQVTTLLISAKELLDSQQLFALLAQTAPPPTGDPLARTGAAVESGVDYMQDLGRSLIAFIPNLLAAVLILALGLIIAAIAKSVVRAILNRTDIDNKIAGALMGRSSTGELPKVENLIANVVFWIVVLFTAIAVLQALQLEAVSRPLGGFLNTILSYIPRILGAAILLGVAWVVATVVKLLVTRGLHAARLDERLDRRPRTPGTTPPPNTQATNQVSITDTIANALYWFIFLLFLIPILDTLDLRGALQPIENLVSQVLSALPNILAAILIAAAGWLLATVVRRIVTNLLASTGIDRAGTQFGLRSTSVGQSVSGIIGTIVYVLILIPVAIAALQQLQIRAISEPAIAMLQQVLNAIPAIFTAALILILAYFLGRFVGDLVANILASIGFNNIFSILGLPTGARRRSTTPPRYADPAVDVPSTGQPTFIQPDTTPKPQLGTRTPSDIVGVIVLVGIMLFATVAAVNVLGIPALTALISGITVIFGRILAGLVVFGIGLFLANLAYNIITSSGNLQAQILGQVARIAIIGLVSAMSLQQIGIAQDIVNLAFGLLLGAIAVASAIAFGLGGREIAGEQIRELLGSFGRRRI